MQCQIKSCQFRGVNVHLKLLHHAAPGVDVRDTRYGAQLRANHIVLQILDLDGRQRVRLHEILKDLAHCARRWTEHRLYTRGEIHCCVQHSLLHLRARKVQIDIIVKRHGNDRNSSFRNGANIFGARHAEHGRFHWKADLLLDFLGR